MTLNASDNSKPASGAKKSLKRRTPKVKKQSSELKSKSSERSVSRSSSTHDSKKAVDNFWPSVLALLVFGSSLHLIAAFCPYKISAAFLVLLVSCIMWEWLGLHALKLTREEYLSFDVSNILTNYAALDYTKNLLDDPESPPTPGRCQSDPDIPTMDADSKDNEK